MTPVSEKTMEALRSMHEAISDAWLTMADVEIRMDIAVDGDWTVFSCYRWIRKPKSRKRRIRLKWRKRWRNWGVVRVLETPHE